MHLDLNEFADPYKVVVGIANEEYRATVIARLSEFCVVYDIYQDPDFLLPRLLEIPCFFRVLDYPVYKVIEPNLENYHDPKSIEGITPILIYSVPKEGLIQHPCLINGDDTHPQMVSQFFIYCRKNVLKS